MKISHESLSAPVITSMEELRKIVDALRTFGQSIVLTQGVWDMFHPGHARYLAKAKQMGDILIVGVDSDEMARVRKADKWPPRPFDPYNERIEIVSFGRAVDFVVVHANLSNMDDTLEIIRPDVFVVSMSTGPEIQGKLEHFRQFAGRIENWPPQASTSTTAKIRKFSEEIFVGFKNEIEEAITSAGEDCDINQLRAEIQRSFDKLKDKITL